MNAELKPLITSIETSLATLAESHSTDATDAALRAIADALRAIAEKPKDDGRLAAALAALAAAQAKPQPAVNVSVQPSLHATLERPGGSLEVEVIEFTQSGRPKRWLITPT